MINLLPVKLLGKDSTEVESLPSYLARTARIHHVSIGVLLRHIFPDMEKYQRSNRSYLRPEALIQANKKTNEIAEALTIESGEPIQQGTLCWMQNTVARSCLEIQKGYRWCPECFMEMKQSGIDPYIKLKWHLSSITYCPEHKKEFISKCYNCGFDQITYHPHDLSVCQRCGGDLTHRINDELAPIRSMNTDNGYFNDVLRLLEDMAEVKFKPLTKGGALKSINDIFNQHWKQGQEDKFYQLFGRDEALSLIHKQAPMSFSKAREYAHIFWVPIYNFLNGEATQESTLYKSQINGLDPKYLTDTIRRPSDHNETLNNIVVYLNKNPEPSLRRVCRDNGVSVGYMRYRHPQLVNMIVNNYKEKVVKDRLKKVYYSQKKAIEYFFDKKYRNCSKSKRQAYKKLKTETNFSKHTLKEAINRAYNAMHIS